ncbi:Por secretion system C-terminal sorting domain-containing protein [Tangfeifania diversioriginum]|uniref:Por secretion system C-terminal sorting domain-containing protein n=1 Tax=Tangfeifania diversioriginum TaxID=1168035 RepID=A0A1M6F6E6_9BACT|nr:T9SS type A sorting domain-containing protein [Tangfeifania diversioriginum]SHI93236.1 Por secretion system C-terminal sorting domain-containing protein [Tangfeifania diversioriginum]
MKTKNLKKVISVTTGLILLFSVVTFGQDQSLIEISNEAELSLKNEHSKKVEKLKYRSVELIKLGNVSKLSKTNNGTLPVKIPGTNKFYVARPVDIVTSSDGQTDVDYHSVINMDAGFGLKSVEITTDSEEMKVIAQNQNIEIFELSPDLTIYPNPVQNNATISYYVKEKCKVSIEVFDTNGRKVETVINSIQDKGKYFAQINISIYKSGVYFCKLSLKGQSFSQKIVIE